MNYKCPLCLTVLTTDQKLARFCTDHPDKTEEFNCTRAAFDERIACPVNDECSRAIEPRGVFLRHVGCEAKNPFKDPDLVDRLNALEHWEVNMLRAVAQSGKQATASEMWFPLMLLRATAEMRKGKRCGALVELVGQRSAGKTVLSMQAMDYQGYVPHDERNSRHVVVDDYIFSRAGTASQSALIDTLNLRTLMDKNATSCVN